MVLETFLNTTFQGNVQTVVFSMPQGGYAQQECSIDEMVMCTQCKLALMPLPALSAHTDWHTLAAGQRTSCPRFVRSFLSLSLPLFDAAPSFTSRSAATAAARCSVRSFAIKTMVAAAARLILSLAPTKALRILGTTP